MRPSVHQTPAAGERLLRFVGDRVRIELRIAGAGDGWRAHLRTNLGRARIVRDEIVAARGGSGTWGGASWRDVPMRRIPGGWAVEVALTEVGWFRAKAYAIDADGHQHWPAGDDLGLCVHPAGVRAGNTIYCAFPRMFGPAKAEARTRDALRDEQLAAFDRHGWTVIPPSGKLRDLAREIPHIFDRLGCRILHLLPVTPTPTTYARFGRFGSPYASQDLTAIDPALVEFDRRTTAVDQFRELTAAVHVRDGRVILDVVLNHTGWGSRLQDERPEWFKRNADGGFHSPGAWGTTWEDLVELDHGDPDLWEEFAVALRTWCGRGVDGFRCDAGYMVPVAAWQYVIARVRQTYPDTVFFLEGLGGAWEITEQLLTEGGMQWAYSELFQNYEPRQVSGYLDHALRQGERVGVLVNYSETHDNDRLAKQGAAWSWLRNALCAFASRNGGFGFTSGVEWLADEKLEVHQARGLRWGAQPNLVERLAALNRLVADHPCFQDGATVERLSADDSPIVALARRSADGIDACLCLVNLDRERKATIVLDRTAFDALGAPGTDLVGPEAVAVMLHETTVSITLAPAAAHALAPTGMPQGLAGAAYRDARAQVGFAYRCLAETLPPESIGPVAGGWQSLARFVADSPARFLAALPRLDPADAAVDLIAALHAALAVGGPPLVVILARDDRQRIVPVPPGHWVLIQDDAPFRADVQRGSDHHHLRSTPCRHAHVVALAPAGPGSQAVRLARCGEDAAVAIALLHLDERQAVPAPAAGSLALLANGRGGMARLHADLGRVASKYDCLLGANLHPGVPCDRHVLAKRLRAWLVADGFITPLDGRCLASFAAGPPAAWCFVAPAGDGRMVEIHLSADMVPDANTVVLRVQRPDRPPLWGATLPADREVRITLRIDLEDRSFHGETRRDAVVDAAFAAAVADLPGQPGFRFQPAPDRRLTAAARGAGARWHRAPEWSLGISHPVEASRGMAAGGDAFSPGWFDLPLAAGGEASVVVSAEAELPPPARIAGLAAERQRMTELAIERAGARGPLTRTLAAALDAFLVRRDDGMTVIAGYPWFLDWGRDTFIAARGLLAAGHHQAVADIIATFARFVDRGTLPNILAGETAGNRDTSDAPLWFALAAEECAAHQPDLWARRVRAPGGGELTIAGAVAGIAAGYLAGTPNGIRVDPASGLVRSPPHFTWMDTNHPAATPRAGYPIEIQALWIRLLRLCRRLGIDCPDPAGWAGIEARAMASLERFWIEAHGWYADCLHGGGAAADAAVDDALRPNQLLLISLGLVGGVRARRAVEACRRWLLVPGALRSLAPLPVDLPLPVTAADGRPLNDPRNPYWGQYLGDEDTRRKPAYHNGTAWVWQLPLLCEAMALAWDRHPDAIAAARAYLGTVAGLLGEGCAGQLPEILDGDAPHAQRGCDAQAWSVSEALRVAKLLGME